MIVAADVAIIDFAGATVEIPAPARDGDSLLPMCFRLSHWATSSSYTLVTCARLQFWLTPHYVCVCDAQRAKKRCQNDSARKSIL
jgi:hypothetical protein